MNPPADLTCDPMILAYAVREAIHTRSAHVAVTVARAVRDNADILPAGVRQALTRDIGTWLRGTGPTPPPVDDRPWQAALAALDAARHDAHTYGVSA